MKITSKVISAACGLGRFLMIDALENGVKASFEISNAGDFVEFSVFRTRQCVWAHAYNDDFSMILAMRQARDLCAIEIRKLNVEKEKGV